MQDKLQPISITLSYNIVNKSKSAQVMVDMNDYPILNVGQPYIKTKKVIWRVNLPNDYRRIVSWEEVKHVGQTVCWEHVGIWKMRQETVNKLCSCNIKRWTNSVRQAASLGATFWVRSLYFRDSHTIRMLTHCTAPPPLSSSCYVTLMASPWFYRAPQ